MRVALFRRSALGLAAALPGAALVATTGATAQEALAVADPEVTGPVPVTSALGDPAHGYPFLATDYDLAGHGYVEEEFFLSGEATRYAANGATDATVLSTGHDYTTRIVVRRPVDAAGFNGTVLAEWYNVSNQWDQEVDWFQTHEHLVREGYAWVGVSAQRAGVHSATGLRAWSPDRYGSLDLTDGGTVTDDTLSWDVFSQAVQAVRSPTGVAPLGPLDAERVIATGHSQSAFRLWSYVNSVDPLAGVVDAVVLHGGGPPDPARPRHAGFQAQQRDRRRDQPDRCGAAPARQRHLADVGSGGCIARGLEADHRLRTTAHPRHRDRPRRLSGHPPDLRPPVRLAHPPAHGAVDGLRPRRRMGRRRDPAAVRPADHPHRRHPADGRP